MTNVYSILGFASILAKNNIYFSWRDLLNEKKVDGYIKKLMDKTCTSDNYIGAGIDRSCFINHSGNCVIKVDKSFYVDYHDSAERDSYKSSMKWLGEDCVDGGWTINRLKDCFKPWNNGKYSQNYAEITRYADLPYLDPYMFDYVARIYAFSSNYAVEIMEFCWDMLDPYCYDSHAYMLIENNFPDVHEYNVGINKHGKLVLRDLGGGN